MPGPLDGFKVVELAAWTFVPAAGAVLADWGADVIKVEHPVTGDPQRGLIASGIVPSAGGVNYLMEQPNRGKRSIGIDVATPGGLEVLMRLVETADVFLTSSASRLRHPARCRSGGHSTPQPRHRLRPRSRAGDTGRPLRARADSTWPSTGRNPVSRTR